MRTVKDVLLGWAFGETALERVCRKLWRGRQVKVFGSAPSEEVLSNELATLLLASTYQFWCDLKREPALVELCKQSETNLVLFEVLMFSWCTLTSNVQMALEKRGQREMVIDLEAPFARALEIGLAVCAMHWKGLDDKGHLKGLLQARQHLALSGGSEVERLAKLLAEASPGCLPGNSSFVSDAQRSVLISCIETYAAGILRQASDQMMQMALSIYRPVKMAGS
ncbi:hypothetical protein [Geopseudomonas aromaticivorans]